MEEVRHVALPELLTRIRKIRAESRDLASDRRIADLLLANELEAVFRHRAILEQDVELAPIALDAVRKAIACELFMKACNRAADGSTYTG